MTCEDLSAALDKLLSESMESVVERARTTFDKLSDPHGEQIVLFGAGALGRRTLKGLRQLGIEPLAFCDNNPSAWGGEVERLTILSPENAVTLFAKRATFVLTIWNDKIGHPLSDIKHQIKDFGEVKLVSFLFLFWKYPKEFLPYFCIDVPQKTLNKKKDILEFSKKIADSFSRKCFVDHIKFRLSGDFQALPKKNNEPQYFPFGIFKKSEYETFIDCGAYNGDTLKDFLVYCKNNFIKYYAFEPDTKNFSKLNNKVNSLELKTRSKIIISQIGLSDFRGTLKFDNIGGIDSKVSPSGAHEIICDTIDNMFFNESPTFLKIDIEGGERSAIKGACKIISEKAPIIAIASYHKPNDLWSLGLLLSQLFGKYVFCIRPHAMGGWENILYAIPPSRIVKG